MTTAKRETGGFFKWLLSLAIIGLTIIVTFLAVTAFFPGDSYMDKIELAYMDLWANTTGEQFTPIMRDNPWIYIIPAVGIIMFLGWVLPQRHYGRAAFMYAVFGLGFLAGHVFW